jgi:ferrochelatase
MVMCNPASKTIQKPIITDNQFAVLFMSYGGPDNLDDIEGFLLDIRGGRQTPAELVAEIRERYARIGGKSPLLEITCDQAELTEALLNTPPDEQTSAPQAPIRVYIGMRHWTPYIKDVLTEMVHNGVKNIVTLCMTPYYSKMTVGAYIEKFEEARQALGADDLHVVHIKNWHHHPLYIEAIAEKVREALEKFPAEARTTVQMVFTAHSLPAAIKEQGDPYEDHLMETMHLIINRLEMGATATPPLSDRSHFCYQSAGARKVVWLGPSLDETMDKIIAAGHKHMLIIPIGFLVDHVEILYDLDIEVRESAAARGVHMERTESLNTSPTFIEGFADIIRQTINGEWDAIITENEKV